MEFVFQRSYRGPLRAVLLDWAGTTIDYGCYAPAVVFMEVYKRQDVPITIEQARVPMGAHKKVHIQQTDLEDGRGARSLGDGTRQQAHRRRCRDDVPGVHSAAARLSGGLRRPDPWHPRGARRLPQTRPEDRLDHGLHRRDNETAARGSQGEGLRARCNRLRHRCSGRPAGRSRGCA